MTGSSNGNPPRRGRRGRRTDVDWAAVRAAFEAGENNVSELGQRFGVQRQSIAHRARTENWSTPGQIREQVRSNVIDMTTRRAVEAMGGQAGVDDHAEVIAAELRAQGKIARLSAEAAEKLLREFLDDQVKPGEKQSKADVFNAVITGVKRAVEIGRDINGITAGTPSVQTRDARELPADQVVIVVRKPQEVAS